MTADVATRLARLGITLPMPARPAGAYVPYVVTGALVFVSGQLSVVDGELRQPGIVGADVDLAGAREAARLCALNLLAQVGDACAGDLDRVVRVVRLGGYVACTATFIDHPKVIDGASNLMLDVFGERGRHSRIAVGTPSLPLGASVEIDGVFEIR